MDLLLVWLLLEGIIVLLKFKMIFSHETVALSLLVV